MIIFLIELKMSPNTIF